MTQRTIPPAADLLTPGQAAAIAGVTVRTIYRYGSAGRVTFVTLPSGHRRYHREAIEALFQPDAAA
jgi:predicted site-specific integrase-resolvase